MIFSIVIITAAIALLGVWLFKKRPKEIDRSLEKTLLQADLDLGATKDLIQNSNSPQAAKDEIKKILDLDTNFRWSDKNTKPVVVLFMGVNGVGKTTSIGKVAHLLKKEGKKVLLGAGDTFRAAASEQLEIWAERTGCEIVSKPNADPASVLFDAVKKAQAEDYDFVLCDTAGRLHTAGNLMKELNKVYRVLGKSLEGAPHEVFLVLDGTTGQNALAQAKEFQQAAPITGIILTKLDGTAKGGIIISISKELGIPVRFVGTGETASDLRPFNPDEFTEALFESRN